MGLVQKAYYFWKRNNWMGYAPSLFTDFASVTIDRPVFLLGNQGDGVTLISRFLRRHSKAVSVTGNRDYWTGADEMQRVMEFRLPPKLRLAGRLMNSDPPHPRYFMQRSWSYGCDDLIDAYHDVEIDATESDSRRLQKVIRECLHRFGGKSSGLRFVDKSQMYSVKTRYVQTLLKDFDPHFVLFTRDPYAACYRAAIGKARDLRRYSRFLSFEERFQVAIEHWDNCMRVAMDDSKFLKNFIHFRYEDFLREPERKTRELCEFLDLEFENDMLPAQGQEIPFGTKYTERWYPLRPEINARYYKEQSAEQLDQVEARCGDLAKFFGYEKPSK